MIETLAIHKQELEAELRECVQAFFESNDEIPESIAIEMNLAESSEDNHIHILIKDISDDAAVEIAKVHNQNI